MCRYNYSTKLYKKTTIARSAVNKNMCFASPNEDEKCKDSFKSIQHCATLYSHVGIKLLLRLPHLFIFKLQFYNSVLEFCICLLS
jgi:hypothetical protein